MRALAILLLDVLICTALMPAGVALQGLFRAPEFLTPLFLMLPFLYAQYRGAFPQVDNLSFVFLVASSMVAHVTVGPLLRARIAQPNRGQWGDLWFYLYAGVFCVTWCSLEWTRRRLARHSVPDVPHDDIMRP